MHKFNFGFPVLISALLLGCGSGSGSSSISSQNTPVATIETSESETTLHLYATSNESDDFTLLSSFNLGYGGMDFLINQGHVPDWQENVPSECKNSTNLGIDKVGTCVFVPILQKMNEQYGWAKNSIAVTAVFTKNDSPEMQQEVFPLSKTVDETLESAGYDAQIYYEPELPELSSNLVTSPHYHAAYSHEKVMTTYNENWIGDIIRDISYFVRLNSLSLPGTHDSMALYGGDMAQTQSMDLYEQLKAGIRALDIRCRHYQDACSIHHGRVFQKANLDDVLSTIRSYFYSHPDEFVVMRLKEECDTHSPCTDNTRSWGDTFNVYYQRYGDLFWHPKNADDTNPNLRSMRGKIVILQDWRDDRNFGIKYDSWRFEIHDLWEISTEPKPFYDKWERIRYRLNLAMNTPVSHDSKTFVTFLNASSYFKGVLGFPYFFASGKSSHGTRDPLRLTGMTTPGWKGYDDFPRLQCLGGLCSIGYLGINILSSNLLVNRGGRNRVGIVYADFPGADLIHWIIRRNPTNLPRDDNNDQ